MFDLMEMMAKMSAMSGQRSLLEKTPHVSMYNGEGWKMATKAEPVGSDFIEFTCHELREDGDTFLCLVPVGAVQIMEVAPKEQPNPAIRAESQRLYQFMRDMIAR
jgi:hypothetical protein